MNTHLHITSWVLAFILLIVVTLLHKQGKAKAAKIVQMILRLDYLLILYSGGSLLSIYFGGDLVALALVKTIAGIWVIASMEMVSIRTGKGRPAQGAWIQFFIALIVTLVLGFGVL
ncbi:MAG TPA: YisL family protein [Bacillota bacterium]|nr:YisL family protein [Bacillota bacterium]